MTTLDHNPWICVSENDRGEKEYVYDPHLDFSKENLNEDVRFDVEQGYEGHMDYKAMTLSGIAKMKTLSDAGVESLANADALEHFEAIVGAHEWAEEKKTRRYYAELYFELCVYMKKWYVGAIESGGPLGHSAQRSM